jgi:hypothetical protein
MALLPDGHIGVSTEYVDVSNAPLNLLKSVAESDFGPTKIHEYYDMGFGLSAFGVEFISACMPLNGPNYRLATNRNDGCNFAISGLRKRKKSVGQK